MQDTHKNVPTSPTTKLNQSEEIIDWSLLALLDHHGPCALKELMTDNDCNIDVGRKSQSLNKEVCAPIPLIVHSIIFFIGDRSLRSDVGPATQRW